MSAVWMVYLYLVSWEGNRENNKGVIIPLLREILQCASYPPISCARHASRNWSYDNKTCLLGSIFKIMAESWMCYEKSALYDTRSKLYLN
jgi:hypothetical protein